MTEEKSEEKKKENVEVEDIKDIKYSTPYKTFVVKGLHIDIINKWSQWCFDRGFDTVKEQAKAFALAIDILEGRTFDLINSSKHLEKIEQTIRAHDMLLVEIVNKLEEVASKDSEPQEISPNELARLKAEKLKESKKLAREQEKKTKESVTND